MLIRDAIAADIPGITAIYNSVVRSSTAIYNDQPVTEADRLAYWQSRLDQNYPVLVAVEHDADDPAGPSVLGYATFGDFRSWPGYRFTVEGTIHIREGVRNRGLGTQLLNHLVLRARALHKHSLIAGVDSENEASLRFLHRYGFQEVGRLPEVGHKFNRFLTLVLLQYLLDPAAQSRQNSSRNRPPAVAATVAPGEG
jgi:L-amino acid N-acyltransferase YncA